MVFAGYAQSPSSRPADRQLLADLFAVTLGGEAALHRSECPSADNSCTTFAPTPAGSTKTGSHTWQVHNHTQAASSAPSEAQRRMQRVGWLMARPVQAAGGRADGPDGGAGAVAGRGRIPGRARVCRAARRARARLSQARGESAPATWRRGSPPLRTPHSPSRHPACVKLPPCCGQGQQSSLWLESGAKRFSRSDLAEAC